MNIILTHDTRYGPVCLPFDLLMTLSDSWDTPPNNPNNRRSSVDGRIRIQMKLKPDMFLEILHINKYNRGGDNCNGNIAAGQ